MSFVTERKTATLVERADELARLDALLAEARAGTGATLLVEGPAGIGKTSLLAAARDRAAGSGMTVLHARASELEHDFAMGVVRRWFEPLLRRDEGLLAGAAGLARSVVMEVADAGGTPAAGVLHGLYWLVANLTERAPVLLALDDAHWADDASLRFVVHLAGRVESLPVAVVLCSRDEARAVRPGPLAELERDPATVVIRPATLTEAAVQTYLSAVADGPVAPAFAEACRRATGGNPFLLGELARTLQAAGVAFTAAAAETVAAQAPATVARTVADTLARLEPAARAVARAVATLGDDVPVDLVAELAGLEVADAIAAAAQLVGADILEDALTLHFRHPIVAAAVRATQTAFERGAEHRRAADLLRRRTADPERVALQLMHTAPAGDETVVDELREAASRALGRGAPSTAAALLERALREPPAAASRVQVLMAAGDAAFALGRNDDAATRYDEAFELADGPAARARALTGLFQAAAGRLPDLRALNPRVELLLPSARAHDRELGLRVWSLQLLTLPGGPAWEEAARGAADLPGDTPGEALVLGHLSLPMMASGATADEVARVVGRAARQADALLEEGAATLVVTGIVLGFVWTDRLGDADAVLARMVAAAQRDGSTALFALALQNRAWVRRRAGDLGEAEADARSALAVTEGADAAMRRRSGWAGAGTAAAVPLIGTLLDQGRVEDAEAALIAAHPEEEVEDAPAMTPLIAARMRLRLAQGQHDRAWADWELTRARVERLFGINASHIGDLISAAEIADRLGDPEGRDALLAQARTIAERWGAPAPLGQTLHAAARLSGGPDAVELVREAVGHLERSPVRVELARALVTLGGLLRRRGHRTASREPLRDGHELARRCGAVALAETARAELRASGVRLRREALTGVDSLTASERRISDLAAAGASNAEIAQALFLTVKTVESHLTHAYRKLGVAGRAELTGALARKA